MEGLDFLGAAAPPRSPSKQKVINTPIVLARKTPTQQPKAQAVTLASAQAALSAAAQKALASSTAMQKKAQAKQAKGPISSNIHARASVIAAKTAGAARKLLAFSQKTVSRAASTRKALATKKAPTNKLRLAGFDDVLGDDLADATAQVKAAQQAYNDAVAAANGVKAALAQARQTRDSTLADDPNYENVQDDYANAINDAIALIFSDTSLADTADALAAANQVLAALQAAPVAPPVSPPTSPDAGGGGGGGTPPDASASPDASQSFNDTEAANYVPPSGPGGGGFDGDGGGDDGGGDGDDALPEDELEDEDQASRGDLLGFDWLSLASGVAGTAAGIATGGLLNTGGGAKQDDSKKLEALLAKQKADEDLRRAQEQSASLKRYLIGAVAAAVAAALYLTRGKRK